MDAAWKLCLGNGFGSHWQIIQTLTLITKGPSVFVSWLVLTIFSLGPGRVAWRPWGPFSEDLGGIKSLKQQEWDVLCHTVLPLLVCPPQDAVVCCCLCKFATHFHEFAEHFSKFATAHILLCICIQAGLFTHDVIWWGQHWIWGICDDQLIYTRVYVRR